MHGVVLTPTFEHDADDAGLSDDEVMKIVSAIAADPLAGDLMAGTGGARKMRHAGRGRGKSGGYRTIHYFGGNGVPVFLLAIYGKGDRDNLTKAERNALALTLPRIADAYRKARKEMTKLGQRLLQSAEEALAIAEGRMKPARIYTAEEIDVAAIRGKMKLSQSKFAERFRLSAATVRDWEQHRRTPDRIAANFLRVIAHSPETVDRALALRVRPRPRRMSARNATK